MSYVKLSNMCNSITSALTSNQKFIMPDSLVYCKCCTKMTLYPGHEQHCCPELKVKNKLVQQTTCKSCGIK